MKLYAKTTTERASKGQGGNDFLEIELFIEGNVKIGDIFLDLNDDINNHGDKMNEWVLQWKPKGAVDGDIIAQGHYMPVIKL